MWPWDLVAEDWVAIGTLVLALATFVLAWQNRRVVQASRAQVDSAQAQVAAAREDVLVGREQAETARRSLAVQTQPFLSSVPFYLKEEPYMWRGGAPSDWRDAAVIQFGIHSERAAGGKPIEPRTASIAVPFRNIGAGMAVVKSVAFVFLSADPMSGYASNPVIPSHEMAKAQLEIRSDAGVDEGHWAALERAYADEGDFSVIITYADDLGEGRGAMRLDVYANRDLIHGKWYVRQVHYGDNAEHVRSSPTVSSIPSE